MHNFIVHSNEIACTKSGRLGLDQVFWGRQSDITAPSVVPLMLLKMLEEGMTMGTTRRLYLTGAVRRLMK